MRMKEIVSLGIEDLRSFIRKVGEEQGFYEFSALASFVRFIEGKIEIERDDQEFNSYLYMKVEDNDLSSGWVGYQTLTTNTIHADLIDYDEIVETQVLQAELLGDVLDNNDSCNIWEDIPGALNDIRIESVIKLEEDAPDFDAGTLILRASGEIGVDKTLYRLRVAVDLNLLVLNRVLNGAVSTLDTYEVDLEFGVYYHTVFECQGDRVRAKVWEEGYSEPEEWQIAEIDGAIASGDHGVGFTKFNSGANIAHYDYFRYSEVEPVPVEQYFTDFGE